MSATNRLKASLNTATATPTNTLNFDLRSKLRDELKATGKFTDVNYKFDGRRGHLNLTIRGSHGRAVANVVAAAATKNLTVALTIVTQDYYNTTYRVTTLTEIKPTAPVAKPAVATKPAAKAKPALTTAIATEQAKPAAFLPVSVYFGYDLVGKVDQSLAKQIRQLIEAANKPKTADVIVVDLKTSAKVTVTVPYDVAQAVKAQVPSFTQGEWIIKSTHGVTILKQNANSTTEKTWVIA